MAKQATFKRPTGLLSSGGGSKPRGLLSGSTQRKSAYDLTSLESLLAQNEKYGQQVKDAGGSIPAKGSKPSFLERVMGPLQTPLAAVNAVVHNVTQPDDVDVWGEVTKAAKGEHYITGSDLMSDWGWEPSSGAGKLAKGIAGFAWDIAADPLTYMTFGLGKVTKLTAVERAAKLADSGIDAAKLVKYGVDGFDNLDEVVDVARLASGQKQQLWRGIVKEVAEETKDHAGIKFFGRSVIPGPVNGHIVPKSVRTSKVGMALGSAFDRTYKIRNAGDPFTAAVFAEQTRDLFNAVNKGVYGGVEEAKALAKALPRGSHDWVGIALEESLDDATRARIGELVERVAKARRVVSAAEKRATAAKQTIRNAGKAFENVADDAASTVIRRAETRVANTTAARDALVEELAQLLDAPVDWDSFAIHLKALNGKLSDAEVQRAVDAMQGFSTRMKELRALDGTMGVIGDRGATYFPHVAGIPSKDVLNALNVQSLPKDATPFGFRTRGSVTAKPDYAKGRTYDTLAEALVEDKKFATYAPEVLGKRVASSARAHAGDEFKRRVVKAFGRPLDDIAEGVSQRGVMEVDGVKYAIDPLVKAEIDNLMRPLLDDEAAKGLMDGLNKLTSMWRKYATVYNPGFAPRNAISNYFLAYTKGFYDPTSWAWAAKVRGWMATGQIEKHLDELVPGLKNVTVREFMDKAREHGALKGGQIFEVTSDAMQRGMMRDPIGKVGTAVNEFAEEWGRLAVFQQAWKKHNSARIAAKLTDATLYNYDPKALTNVEQGLRTLIPFMTWTRRNLPEMLSVLVHDPSKISSIGKLQGNMESVSGEVDRDMLPQYMRDMVPIPLPFKDKSGNTLMLNPNFGFQDLNRIDQPLRDTLASINPLFKVPLEIAFNRDVYFQSDIQDYEGQLRKAPGYLQALDDSFEGQDWWELVKAKGGAKTIEGQLRIDPRFTKVIDAIPVLANLGKALETDSPQNPWRTISWLGGVKMMPYQDEKFTKDAEYEQRQTLQDILRKMRDEGVIQ